MSQRALGLLVLLLAATCSWNGVEGLPTGPPPASCSSLSPDPFTHGAPSQTSPSPYELDLSSLDDGSGVLSYTPGQTYLITLRDPLSGSTFRGFMLQGRQFVDDTTVAGTFAVVNNSISSLSSCSPPEISIVHNNPSDKVSVSVLWTAPPAGFGSVRIGFTAVRIRTVYWANFRSPVIVERGGTFTTPNTPSGGTFTTPNTPSGGTFTTPNTPSGGAFTTPTGSTFTTPSGGTSIPTPGPPLFVDDDLLDFGVAFGDLIVLPSLDGSSSNIVISNFSSLASIPFYGIQETTILVNTNGVLSFRSAFSDFTPEPFPFTNDILIALYWDDHDVREGGTIYYRFSQDQSLLTEVGANVSAAFQTSFTPTVLFIATWDRVSQFSGTSAVGNTYQAVIATNGSATYVLFLYRDIQWATTDTNVGFNAGDGVRFFNQPRPFGAPTHLGLTSASNVGRPGTFMFRVDQEEVMLPQSNVTGVTLVVLNAVDTVLEPDTGNNTNATICFQANINQPMNRDIMFEFELSNLTTATLGVDFLPNETASFLTIPANFTGEFFRCLVITVFGDNQFEGDEVIVYELRAVSPLDVVQFRSIVVTIIENDPVVDQGVTLVPLNPVQTVVEPDMFDFINIDLCFTANVSQPLGRDAVFEFVLANTSTATIFEDYAPNIAAPFLTIPALFSGQFFTCAVIQIFGDNEVEGNEVIVSDLVPLSPQDSVANDSTLVITIIDNGQGNVAGVTLVVLNGDTVLEPDTGNNTNATICFQANINQPMNRNIMFEFELSNLTTATLGVDFLPNETASFLTIPANFTGEFFRCLVITVFGDDQFEGDEVIVYELRAVSALDVVQFPFNTSSIVITIIENDPVVIQTGITLVPLNPVQLVVEPNLFDFVNINLCFAANVPQPLGREAVFEFVISNTSTAIIFEDYTPNITSPFLTIPPLFSGRFFTCVVLQIIGDNDVEGNEVIVSDLVPLSPQDSVANDSTLVITIIDNDQAIPPSIVFEQSSYSILEDIGEENLALRVCFNISNLSFEVAVRVSTVSGSAQAGEDFEGISFDLTVRPSDVRRCVAILILEDSTVEPDESFTVTVSLAELILSTTTVTILDDDDMSIRYIGDSPVVVDNSVFLSLSLPRDVVEARCVLLVGGLIQSETNCLSGTANFTLSKVRNTPYTPAIKIVRASGERILSFDTKRNVFLGVRDRCSVHLINGGITRRFIGNGSSVLTTFEWGLSAPGNVDPSTVGFNCILEGAAPFNCTSPYSVVGPSSSPVFLTVQPAATKGCVTRIPRTFRAKISP